MQKESKLQKESQSGYEMSAYEDIIALTRYARWRPEDGRRETWEETVDRLMDFWDNRVARQGTRCRNNWSCVRDSIRNAIISREVMPSMRSLMTAGDALNRDEVAGYNCAYLTVDTPRAFDEAMYILLCGTGVGFSVEEKYVNQLPPIADHMEPSDTNIVVPDSKIGWATSFRELLSLLWAGRVPSVDYSRIRAAGIPLKTFGGRASGPEPLKDLFNFSVQLFSNAKGRKLRPIECHDLLCKVGEIVVVGGVRRSAMISLSDLGNEQMRTAKSGNWWEAAPHRALANNSAVFEGRPDIDTFMREWTSLIESKSGERGIFNRQACRMISEQHGRDHDHEFGTNPCSEIILRPQQFCNLSEVVVRADDTIEQLMDKVRLATIIGTLQSTLTNFRYLSKRWKTNCEGERLLGVSLTGFFDRKEGPDCRPLDAETLGLLREHAVNINREWAKNLSIPYSAAITCVKPSGTVSQLVNSASGLHPRHSRYYIRRIRQDMKDPVTKMLIEQGVPGEPERFNPDKTYIFEFPIKAPEGAITREDLTAVEQLEAWLTVQKHWCQHKPSVTINVREDEWLDVGNFVWKNFDWMSGVSFLPHDGGTYLQAPYEEIDEENYQRLLDNMPTVDFTLLGLYESEDHTTASQELACKGGSCEI